MKKIKIGIIINGYFVNKYTYELARWLKYNNKKFISTCLQEHTKIIIKNFNIIKSIKNTYEKIINEFENNNFTSVKNEYI